MELSYNEENVEYYPFFPSSALLPRKVVTSNSLFFPLEYYLCNVIINLSGKAVKDSGIQNGAPLCSI